MARSFFAAPPAALGRGGESAGGAGEAMRDIRVALIGYGHGGAVFHAPLVHSTPGLRLTAIVTSDPERAARAGSRYPDARILPDADALWAGEAPHDVVVIATPNRTHVPLGLAALARGLAVVIDKPIAATVEDAAALVDEADRRGLLLTVFQNRRWDGDFLTVRRLLAEDRLGAVFRFESRFERWRPSPRAGWRELPDPHDAGGLLFDLGAHLIDQALQLFGSPASVYAELDRRRQGAAVDDDTFVALEHVSGVRSHLWMSAVVAGAGPRVRVVGAKGTYTKYGLDPQEDALRDGADPARPGFGVEAADRWGSLTNGADTQPVPTEPGTYRRFYERLAAALAVGHAAPPVDARDAIRVLEIIDAARRSASARAIIRL